MTRSLPDTDFTTPLSSVTVMNLSPALSRRTSSAWTGGPPCLPSPGRSALRVVEAELEAVLDFVAAPAPAMPMLAPISAQAAIAASARRGVVIFIGGPLCWWFRLTRGARRLHHQDRPGG